MFKRKEYVYGDEDVLVPVHVNVAKDLLRNMLNRKDMTALINASTGASMTYGQIVHQAIRVACWLNKSGVTKGSLIGVCSEKRFEVIPAIIGTLCVGAITTSINMGEERFKQRFIISKPKIIFFSPSALKTYGSCLEELGSEARIIVFGEPPFDSPLDEELDDHDAEMFDPVSVCGWEDISFMFYSSGTTGPSKGVPVTHLSMLLNIIDMATCNYEGKPILNIREWYFTYGIQHTLASLRAGAVLVYTEGQTDVDYLAAIQKYKISIIQATPYDAGEFVKSSALHKFYVGSVEHMLCASTPMDGELVEAVKRSFPNLKNVVQMYGLSETGIICNEKHCKVGIKPGSVGAVSPTYIVKVVDVDTRKPLGPNQCGEICFKTPSLFSGYVGVTGSTSNHLDEEGFFKSGDVGYYDDDKYFYIVDRLKDLIKCDSVTIAPAEIEAVLLQHPSVRDAGVAGLKHKTLGEVATAFVVLQPGSSATAEEIEAFVREKAPSFMRLRGGVKFLPALPRAQGKLNRRLLISMVDDESS